MKYVRITGTGTSGNTFSNAAIPGKPAAPIPLIRLQTGPVTGDWMPARGRAPKRRKNRVRPSKSSVIRAVL